MTGRYDSLGRIRRGNVSTNERILVLVEQTDGPADRLPRYAIIVFHAVDIAFCPDRIRPGGVTVAIISTPD